MQIHTRGQWRQWSTTGQMSFHKFTTHELWYLAEDKMSSHKLAFTNAYNTGSKVPMAFVFIIVSVNDNNFLGTPVPLSHLPKTHTNTQPVPLVQPSSESEPFSHPLKDICSSTSSYTRYAHWPQLCGRRKKQYHNGRKQLLYKVSEANNLWDHHLWAT